MRALRARVTVYDVHRWANHFVRTLSADTPGERRVTPETTLHDTLGAIRGARPLAILLDYDGTLVPIAPTPDEATPDDELLALVDALARRPDTIVLMVSGRSRDTLDRWFGRSPIELWAEHGVWFRPIGAAQWQTVVNVPDGDALGRASALMEEFTAATPGSFVEIKSSSVAWHYRLAARGFGRARARDLRVALSRLLVDAPLEILEGKRVVEVRPRGATKGTVVQHLLARDPAPAMMLAFGDDRTDEEMFAVLPRTAVSVHVGSGASLAKVRVRDSAGVRRILNALVHQPTMA
jgi:trehalose 6-phosphate synthase/phosphatase